MIYRVRHMTRYDYRSPVNLSVHLAHLRPRSLSSQQVLSAEVRAAPAVSWRREGSDHFGNDVTWLSLDAPHAVFEVTAECNCRCPLPRSAGSSRDAFVGDGCADRGRRWTRRLAGRGIRIRQSARAGTGRGTRLRRIELYAKAAHPRGAAGHQCAHQARFHLQVRRDNDVHADTRSAAAAARCLPGLRAPDDQPRCGASAFRRGTCPDTFGHSARPGSHAVWARISRTPGLVHGLVRNMAGSIWTQPMASSCATNMSCLAGAAITATSPR